MMISLEQALIQQGDSYHFIILKNFVVKKSNTYLPPLKFDFFHDLWGLHREKCVDESWDPKLSMLTHQKSTKKVSRIT